MRSFGVQAHPTLKGIEITNNGIDIKAGGSSEVQAVYAGKVAGTQFIPGYQNLVILQHGNYYTVYSNLEDVFVRRGETVDAAQRIGSLGSKKELHFELWKEKQHLNPVHWLSK
ncbi:MAG: M23 family metallopeptidase [Saprospiraceae bacterium]|nr:M23 family metallopeptidase [Saprospiraceae bacterium]